MLKVLLALVLGFSVALGVSHYRMAIRLQAIESGTARLYDRLASGERQHTQRVSVIPPTDVHIDPAFSRGHSEARVGLIIYSDFQCPFCAKFARETLPQIEERFVATGKVIVAFKQFPLEAGRRMARVAALAAVCAGRAGRFWALHDELFLNTQVRDVTALAASWRAAGLADGDLRRCEEDRAADDAVQAELEEAKRFGLTGTPAFVAGGRRRGIVTVETRLMGALPMQRFEEVLDQLLVVHSGVR